MKAINPSRYTDGVMKVYKVIDSPSVESPDFPERKLKSLLNGAGIWYRELSIYDRTRVTFQQADIAVNRKIRVPYWAGFEAGQVCVIDGEQMSVFNHAKVWIAEGYADSELTLISPEVEYEIAEE